MKTKEIRLKALHSLRKDYEIKKEHKDITHKQAKQAEYQYKL